jgi:hypothetical protein
MASKASLFQKTKRIGYFNVMNIAGDVPHYYCYNIEKLADKPWYTDSQNSMIFLEPDYLLMLQRIAKCFNIINPIPCLFS